MDHGPKTQPETLPDAQLEFVVHGVSVVIKGPASVRVVLDDLRSEFEVFESKSQSTPIDASAGGLRARPDIELTLHDHSARELPNRWSRPTKLGAVSTSEGVRWVRFHDGSWVSFRDHQGRRKADAGIASNEACALIENFLHSSLGEQFEQRGFVRFHALGFTKMLATIELAPRGFGKSTKAERLLGDSSAKLFGDETVLLKDGVVYPYPVRIATQTPSSLTRTFLGSTKFLRPIPKSKVAAPTRLSRINFYTRAPFGLRRLSFIVSLSLGLGLPQMKEYMLRRGSVLNLARFFFQRLRTALQLALSSQLKLKSGPYLEP